MLVRGLGGLVVSTQGDLVILSHVREHTNSTREHMLSNELKQ